MFVKTLALCFFFFTASIEGAVLASPLNEKLRDAIIHLTLKELSVSTIFTGVHAYFSQGDYASIEGVPLLRLAVRWAVGEPDNRENAERCVAMETAVNGSLSDVSCARTLPYVCYKEKAPMVVTSCGTHDPVCLGAAHWRCYKFHKRGLVWPKAHLTCAAEGAHLAVLNSEMESLALKDLYAKHPDKTILSKNAHIASVGFLDWLDGGSWMTIHGETLTEAGYDQWEPKMPDNQTRAPLFSSELCGSFLRSGKLNDIACDLTLPFICEKKPESLQDIVKFNELEDYTDNL